MFPNGGLLLDNRNRSSMCLSKEKETFSTVLVAPHPWPLNTPVVTVHAREPTSVLALPQTIGWVAAVKRPERIPRTISTRAAPRAAVAECCLIN